MAALTLLTIGETVTATRTLTQADFDRFAAVSGDDNPIHVAGLRTITYSP